MMKRLPILFALVALSGCATTSPVVPPQPASDRWERVSPGVDYARFGDGVTSSWHVARVDLTNPDVVFFGSSEEDRGRTVSDFAAAYDATVAVNGDYFDAELAPVGPMRGYCGEWDIRAAPVERRQPIFVAGGGRAEIIDLTENLPAWADVAVSGWPRLVTRCRAFSSSELPGSDHFTRAPHVRTAVGLSRDARTAYIVVADLAIDGRYGVTLAELGEFMRESLNVCEALNLDGGGSSALVINERLVSRPKSGRERHVANHLGIARRGSEPVCERELVAQAADWARIGRERQLEAEQTAHGARYKLPFHEGSLLVEQAGSDVIATGSFVTDRATADALQRELRGDLRVSWITGMDDGRARVQIGGRGELESMLRGLDQILARR